ncbi:hypothetical protein V496_01278 [Pseudogymnoascus sp. VKM F-4515 (FW-2607)]|nr:hypothetical protein V496_01278 [Pseudogymnoascus sp. VKM F-4515 (FW-2607)]
MAGERRKKFTNKGRASFFTGTPARDAGFLRRSIRNLSHEEVLSEAEGDFFTVHLLPDSDSTGLCSTYEKGFPHSYSNMTAGGWSWADSMVIKGCKGAA